MTEPQKLHRNASTDTITEREFELPLHIDTLTTAIEDVMTILEEWPLAAADADRAYRILAALLAELTERET